MADRSTGLGTWLVIAWGFGAAGYGLWRLAPWALAVGAALVGAAVASVLFGRWRRKVRGYWVEHVSSNVVRAREGEFMIVYHEGEERLSFDGFERPRPERDVVRIPSPERWDSTVLPWARGRRAEIVARLRAHPVVKGCEIAEDQDSAHFS